MSPRAGSLSNEPLAVPGKSISSNSFLSSSQVGFPLQDWGRARKGSVALVDDHSRWSLGLIVCVCARVCFTILELMFFNRFLWSSKSIHPSTLPSDLSQRTSSLYLIPKDSHPQKESSRRSQQLHVSLRGPGGPGDNSCFAPKEPSPRALCLRSARAPTADLVSADPPAAFLCLLAESETPWAFRSLLQLGSRARWPLRS